jgi:hypothetical protein
VDAKNGDVDVGEKADIDELFDFFDFFLTFGLG